jgi:hypothetical protein
MDPRPDWHCRIGKIRPKDGRRPVVRVLRPEDYKSSTPELLRRFQDDVEHMIADNRHNAAGYAIVIWDRAGYYQGVKRVSNCSPIATRLVPGVVAEVTREITTGNIVRGILRNEE